VTIYFIEKHVGMFAGTYLSQNMAMIIWGGEVMVSDSTVSLKPHIPASMSGPKCLAQTIITALPWKEYCAN
jgi:hypothetical protein